MSSWVSSGSTATPVTMISQVPTSNGSQPDTPAANSNVARQITLTQTLTKDGFITTAVVTLDRGTPPSEAPPPPDPSTRGSGGMPSNTIGLIVGITVGIVVLFLAVACCVIARRRSAASDSDDEYSEIVWVETPTGPTPMTYEYMREARRTGWRFPRSIPPPTLRPGERPVYRATTARQY